MPDLEGTWRFWCDLIMIELSALQEAQTREHGSADFRTAAYADGAVFSDDRMLVRRQTGIAGRRWARGRI